MKFRKKPVQVEATQWFSIGDHEKVVSLKEAYNKQDPTLRCGYCNLPKYDHGWIDTLEGGHIVCPGDWIITGVAGENYLCKNSIFQETYEAVLTDDLVEQFGKVLRNKGE